MFNFFHNQVPDPILISLGPINIYWYGFCIMLGVVFAMLVLLKLSKYYKVDMDTILDLVFYLMLAGIIGARIYDIFLEYSYYSKYPIEMFKIWKGGLAIHGGLIAGCLALWVFAKKKKIDFWRLSAMTMSVLPLAQAFGRWGNYFNNELFGLPTDASWGIPVLFENRVPDFLSYEFFHPTFLYESIGNFFIFILILLLNIWMIRSKKTNEIFFQFIVSVYLVCYSVLRFFLEFVRIDVTLMFANLRFPQIASIIIVFLVIIFWTFKYYKFFTNKHRKTLAQES